MFKKIFRKVFLLAGIFLLGTFMLVQLSWGCDDHDGWDYDHHDKWSCDEHGMPCHPPKIQRVFLEYKSDSITFTILGKNFDNGAPPVVTLGGISELSVTEYSGDQIIATLPIPEEEEFIYGDYRLVVSTCRGSECKDKYCKDHGSNCKCKYCKDHCSKCKDKYCKDKYCKEHEYKCKCKDKYSLTIPDPAEPQGKPGIIKSEIVEVTKSVAVRENTPIFDPDFKVEDTASCNTLGAGWTVTGGGFLISKNLAVEVSMPVKNENGWHVVGTPVVSKVKLSGDTLEITIYAVCAIVQ